ncbi:head GIN domain-containing protein [Flavobacterium sp. N1994]|uniref:head GIN domain-containing protein n=1 Tax=Flavobacterium sp. N1994 TaxID=2986827 RepID=UPI00222150A2|nr:head GIN domain-containing protein [Flavobacterium sp. N1994]
MSKVIATGAAILISLIASSQVSENRNVAEFSKLKASTGIDVFYTVSSTTSVKVETDDNDKLQYIKTEVEGETLKVFVETKKNNYNSNSSNGKNINGIKFKTLKVYITGKALTAVKASSSAKIKMQNLNSANQVEIAASSSGSVVGNFDCDEMKVDVSSSGDFDGNVNAKTINIESSSSADVDLDGKTITLQVKASSSSSCNLKKLLSENAKAKASSSADVTLNVTKSLDAEATSSASINYYGNPAQVNAEKGSSGSVNKK